MMRFRKRVKVFPGFYLNFSKSGISSTLGVKGASINISKRGTYLNTSIPGMGSQRIKTGHVRDTNDFKPYYDYPTATIPNAATEIKSAALDQLTSTSFKDLNDTLLEVYNDRIALKKEIRQAQVTLHTVKTINILACVCLVGFFINILKKKMAELEDYLADLEKQLNDSRVNIDMHFDTAFEEKYSAVAAKYKELLKSQIIWDITSSAEQDRVKTRSAASHSVTRVPVNFRFDNISIIKSTYQALHFENKNGGDLYIYPAFVIITTDQKDFALVDIKDFEMTFSQQRFLEEEKIPSDTQIVDRTWAKVNKNGTPDKRFSNNYEIPIVQYGQLNIRSRTGLNEVYTISNYGHAREFVAAFMDYQDLLNN